MKRLFAATTFGTICAVVLSAQSVPSQSVQSQELKEKEKVVTVSGCLQAGEEPSSFVLSNAKWLDKDKSAAGTTSTGATGTSGSTDAPTTTATLRLVGSPSGVRMSEHVGHLVEITGVIIDEVKSHPTAAPDPVSTGTGGDQTARTQPPSPSPTPKPEHTLNVRTVKMSGESCGGR